MSHGHETAGEPGHGAAHDPRGAWLRRVEALCGERFVPQQDPKKLPLCGTCKEIYDLYRQIGDGGLSETPGS